MMTGATTSHDNDSATTVIVVTRNRRALLTETITRHPRPVIVVDDASTDETATAMQEQDVGLIRLRRSQGPSARTCGARQATTRYVAFADDDSWWAPGSLERAAGYLDAYPQVPGFVARVLVEPDGRPDPFNDVLASSTVPGVDGPPGVAVLGFMACALVMRRELFVELGGFSRLMGRAGEEELLALDVAQAGEPLRYWPTLTVHHAPKHRYDRTDRRAELIRSSVVTALLRRPWRQVRQQLVDAVRAGSSGRRALAQVLFLMPRLLSRRRPLDAETEATLRMAANRMGT